MGVGYGWIFCFVGQIVLSSVGKEIVLVANFSVIILCNSQRRLTLVVTNDKKSSREKGVTSKLIYTTLPSIYLKNSKIL